MVKLLKAEDIQYDVITGKKKAIRCRGLCGGVEWIDVRRT